MNRQRDCVRVVAWAVVQASRLLGVEEHAGRVHHNNAAVRSMFAQSVNIAACLVIAGLLSGCGKPDLSQPPTVRLGEEACAYCRMIISDQRFAAAIVDEDGEAFKFDDIGCLVQYADEHVQPGAVSWVHGFDGQKWVNARGATFVYSSRIVSPMNHGLAAFADARAAAKLATDPGIQILQFTELARFVGQRLRATAFQSPRP
jgi:copper chaperone NosL